MYGKSKMANNFLIRLAYKSTFLIIMYVYIKSLSTKALNFNKLNVGGGVTDRVG